MKRSYNVNKERLVAGFLVLAVLLRLSILIVAYFHPERTLTNDSSSYIEPAQYLLRDGAYTYPSALRTPVYPIFLAVIYKLFGESHFFVVLVQTLIGLATIYLTYLLSTKLLPSQKKPIGILFFAFGLESSLGPFYVMTETLFTFLLVCILLCFLIYRQSININYGWLAVGGVLTGLAILCRPIALYFPAVILLFILWEHRRDFKRWLASSAIYVFMVLICVIPWIVRNNRLLGIPVVSTITGDSLYFYSANALLAHQQQIGFFESQQVLYPALDQALLDANLQNTESNRYRMEVYMARKIILSEPFTYLYVHLRESMKIFLPGTASLRDALGQSEHDLDLWDLLQTQGLFSSLKEYFRQTNGLQLILLPFVILLIVTCLFGFWGMWILLRNKNWFELLVLSMPVFYFILLSGPGSYSRFRIPIMPFLSIVAGIGIETIKNNHGKKAK